MRFLPVKFDDFLQRRASQRNRRLVMRVGAIALSLLALFSICFRLLMALEGREVSWVTSIYWTVTMMSTLGLGDIVFTGDPGRAFTVVVHLSGLICMLVLLPFVFFQFFQSTERVPRDLPDGTRGHVVLTHNDPITRALIQKLAQYRQPYVLVVPDLVEALQLHDAGAQVVVGALDDPETYRNVRAAGAALVAATGSDTVNATVVLNCREAAPDVPLVATALADASTGILKTAGASQVLRLGEMLGRSLARRASVGCSMANIIGEFDGLLIAEATAAGTPLVGKTLREARLRELVGVNVVGVWERGRFETARAETPIGRNTVLVLAGSREQLGQYDELFCIYYTTSAPLVIIGAGSVGRAAAATLAARDIDYRLVDRDPRRAVDDGKHVTGDAVDPAVLDRAGIGEAPAVLMTTHDDEMNTYLTLQCRQRRPDIQIISRAVLERSVHTLHHAGADFVMSYASMGATSIFNRLQRGNILMIAEGLDVFRVPMPTSLVGRTIAESEIRPTVGCTVVAISGERGTTINPGPGHRLEEAEELILIGSVDNENRFLARFGSGIRRPHA